MSSIFTKVQMPQLGTNKFDLSHDIKTSFNMGELVPTTILEVVPGDIFNIRIENMLRFSPLLAPIMHKVKCTTHYFFVPNRILWPEWEDFITGNVDVEPPYFNNWNGLQQGTLGDYMGLPLNTTTATLKCSALPFAAYRKIFDEYYRDQNLQIGSTYEFEPLIQGDNTATDLFLDLVSAPKKRAWMHDYFTSCLPFAQKGDAVTLPLTANEQVDVTVKPWGVGTQATLINKVSDGTAMANVGLVSNSGQLFGSAIGAGYIDPNGMLEVNINDEAVDITTLRRAFRLQEWLEKNARGGTRYIENIQAHFGVKSSDKRLQRPEYLGGARHNMTISEVLSATETLDDTNTIVNPVGAFAGHGLSAGNSNTFNYRAEEHGFIIGIINVQPDTAYLQGLHKMWSRTDKLDYYWPSFAHIGEQEVLNKELYAYGINIDDTFGYIPRYSEYKYLNSRVSGEMRTSLNYWHLGRIFDNVPALNSEFIECNPDRRIFAVTDEDVDTIYAHIYNGITAIRKMPYFGNPTI